MRVPLVIHSGLVAVLDRSNIDTDAILPKPFLKRIDKQGFGQHLFDEWRYTQDFMDDNQDVTGARPENQAFILNQHPWRHASILLTRDNFACGSSREHAVWALLDYGIRVVLAESYGDIFYANAIKNGLLPVVLKQEQINTLIQVSHNDRYLSLVVDLCQQQVVGHGYSYPFSISAADRDMLMSGKDDIAATLEKADRIRDYETHRKQIEPWL